MGINNLYHTPGKLAERLGCHVTLYSSQIYGNRSRIWLKKGKLSEQIRLVLFILGSSTDTYDTTPLHIDQDVYPIELEQGGMCWSPFVQLEHDRHVVLDKESKVDK